MKIYEIVLSPWCDNEEVIRVFHDRQKAIEFAQECADDTDEDEGYIVMYTLVADHETGSFRGIKTDRFNNNK